MAIRLGYIEEEVIDAIKTKQSDEFIYNKIYKMIQIYVCNKKTFLSYDETKEFIEFFAEEMFLKLTRNREFDVKYLGLYIDRCFLGYMKNFMKNFSTSSYLSDEKLAQVLSLETENILISNSYSQQDVLSDLNCKMYIDNICRTTQGYLEDACRINNIETKNNTYLSALMTLLKKKICLVGIDEDNITRVEFSIKNAITKLLKEVSVFDTIYSYSISDLLLANSDDSGDTDD